MKKKIGSSSPWGKIQDIKYYSDDICEISTPGHGGFLVGAKSNAKIPQKFRNKNGFYEEDCEFVHVVMAFPDLFTKEQVETARSSFHYQRKREAEDKEFAEKNKNNWVVCSAFGDWHHSVPKGYVGLCTTLGGKGYTADGTEKYFLVTDVKNKTSYHKYVIDLSTAKEWSGPNGYEVTVKKRESK